MPRILARCLAAAVLLHAAIAQAQQATDAPRPFAAPSTADSLPAGTAGGIGQTTFALLIVLAAIFGLAWLARRMRGLARGGAQGIDVIAQAAVGPRERVVVVRIGQTRLLLGVAPGRVSRLHELPADVTLDQTPGNGDGAAKGGAAAFVESFRSLMARGGRPGGGR